MIAFHGSSATKEKYLARVRMHRAADHLVQGETWENGRGCAIGCTLEGYDHKRYETELGIPEVIAHIEDRIFEGLPAVKAMEWPADFLAAISVGADLSKVWPQFATWMLRQCLGFTANEEAHGILDHVAYLYEIEAPRSGSRWSEARDAAWALRDAAATAATAHAASAAYAHAAAAATTAAAAAAAYATTSAHAAAREEFWMAAADQLIALLRAAPVPA